jgi:type IV pilus assembly protein PilW
MKHYKQHGFTLVELMIAMLLGLLLIGALLTMLSQTRKSFRQDETYASMQDESRHAMQELSRDISMAGFVGDVMSPDVIALDGSLAIGDDCASAGGESFIEQFADSGTSEYTTLMAVDNITAASATAAFSCLDGGELVAGTDIVAIKRLVGEDATDDLEDGDIAIRQNGSVAILFIEPITDVAYVTIPYEERIYAPAIYYIRDWTNTDGDDIPSLCRMVIEGGASADMVNECIAEGIEDLQVEYGIDTNADGAIDEYVADPSSAQLESAISARVHLLARTADEDFAYTDNRTYTLSNADDYVPDDGFRRRVYTTTVSIQNVRNRVLMFD